LPFSTAKTMLKSIQ